MSFTQLIKKYAGKWVALEPDSQVVLSSGDDAQTVFMKAKKKGVEIPTLFRVPEKYIPNIG